MMYNVDVTTKNVRACTTQKRNIIPVEAKSEQAAVQRVTRLAASCELRIMNVHSVQPCGNNFEV